MIPGVSSLTDANAASNEFILDALFPGRARCARSANVRGLRFLTTTAVRITRGTARTLARERSWLVVADGALWAWIDGALVDIPATALHPRLARVTTAAETCGHVVGQHAMGIRPAGQILARI